MLNGGDGNDRLWGDAFQLTDNAVGGNDQIDGGAGNDQIQGDAGVYLTGSARGGDDILLGNSGTDGLFGDGWLFDYARGGNDQLFGGEDNDSLYGDDYFIRDHGRGGNDRVDGGAGDDTVRGDCVAASNFAVCGNDVLIGGVGSDRLYGDSDPTQSALGNVTRGVDRFVFANGSGMDSIFDFENNKDIIDLTGFLGIDSIGDIIGSSSQVGANVEIDLGAAAGGPSNSDVLTLINFILGNLDNVDFTFG